MFWSPTYSARPAGFLALLALAIGADPAHSEGAQLFNIPPGPAMDALDQWSRQTHIQVLYDFHVVKHYRARGVGFAYRPLDALGAMLLNTPLAFDVINDHTVSVILGGQYCEPWLGAHSPLPPCEQMPPDMQGAQL
jgi:hypothetical protein